MCRFPYPISIQVPAVLWLLRPSDDRPNVPYALQPSLHLPSPLCHRSAPWKIKHTCSSSILIISSTSILLNLNKSNHHQECSTGTLQRTCSPASRCSTALVGSPLLTSRRCNHWHSQQKILQTTFILYLKSFWNELLDSTQKLKIRTAWSIIINGLLLLKSEFPGRTASGSTCLTPSTSPLQSSSLLSVIMIVSFHLKPDQFHYLVMIKGVVHGALNHSLPSFSPWPVLSKRQW